MRQPAIAAFLVGIAARALALALVPVMHGGDSYARLVDPRVLVKAVWLPGYQLVLAATSFLAADPLAFRAVTGLIGALAAAAGAVCAGVWWGPRAAWFAGMALALAPGLVLLSVHLYQEPLFVALVLTAGAFARTHGPGHPATIAAMGAACLTRFEAWPIALVLALASGPRRGGLHLLVPVAWGAWWGDAGPMGLASVHPGLTLERVADRVATLAALVPREGAVGIVALAGIGVLLDRRRSAPLVAAAGFWVIWLATLDPYAGEANPRQSIAALVTLMLLGAVAAQRLGVVSGLALVPLALTWPAQLRAQYDVTMAEAAAAARLLADEAGPILVVSDEVPGWPDAVPPACEAVRGQVRGRVVCHNEPALDPAAVLALGPHTVETRLPVAVLAPFALYGAVDASTLPAVLAAVGLPLSCEPRTATSLVPLAISGKAVLAERTRIALYSNGSVTLAAPSGPVGVWACGTPSGWRLPRFRIERGDAVVSAEAETVFAPVQVPDGPGELRIVYEDDQDDASGDRNLFVGAIR